MKNVFDNFPKAMRKKLIAAAVKAATPGQDKPSRSKEEVAEDVCRAVVRAVMK